MYKYLHLTLLFTLFSGWSFGQGELDNGDFENWTNDTVAAIPDFWNTLTLSGVENTFKSTDAANGVYSIRLETVEENGDTIPAFAMLGTAGDNGFFGVPYTSEPDTLHGSFKYDIAVGDSAFVLVYFSSFGIPLGLDAYPITGTETNWTQMDLPITPLPTTPDSVWIGIVASNIFNEMNAMPGSWIMADHLWFSGSGGVADPIPNGDFEMWTDITVELPDDYNTFSNELALLGATPNTTRSADAFSGNSSARLESILYNGEVIPGVVTNGEVADDLAGGIPYMAQPATFSGAYKYAPVGVDTGFIGVMFFSDAAGVIDSQFIAVDVVTSAWTPFNVTLNVASQPDSMIFVAWSGSNTGSVMHIDGLELSGGTVSIANADEASDKIKIWPNPVRDRLNVAYELSRSKNATISVHDLSGRRLITVEQNAGRGVRKKQFDMHDLPRGAYLITLKWDGGRITQKVIRQ